MAHQLYVLQVLTFNLLEERMMTKMDPNDQVKNVDSFIFRFFSHKFMPSVQTKSLRQRKLYLWH